MTNNDHQLIIAISIPNPPLETDFVNSLLSSIAFIGDRLIDSTTMTSRQSNSKTHVGEQTLQVFAVGEKFFSYITYLGCSPFVEPSTKISILFGAMPRFIYGANTESPSCPSCHNKIEDWRHQLESKTHFSQWRCATCTTGYSADQLRWRKRAGTGNIFIMVDGIYQNEALPNDELLESLAGSGANKCDYFYVSAIQQRALIND